MHAQRATFRFEVWKIFKLEKFARKHTHTHTHALKGRQAGRRNFKALQASNESRVEKRNGQTIVKPANKAASDSEHIFFLTQTTQTCTHTHTHTQVVACTDFSPVASARTSKT